MKKNIPCSIGVIMDGNRRFATLRGKNFSAGHRLGYETFKKFLEWARDLNVGNVIVYAFSTENWKRKKNEVRSLILLFTLALKELEDDLSKNKLKGLGAFTFPGDLGRFPSSLQTLAESIEKKTKRKRGMKVAVALSYGGRGEILRAAFLCRGKRSEREFRKHLLIKNIPDPEMIIRTGGEIRLSNFLLWQSAYSELFFTKTLWPEFSKKEFLGMLHEYGTRKRNFGK